MEQNPNVPDLPPFSYLLWKHIFRLYATHQLPRFPPDSDLGILLVFDDFVPPFSLEPYYPKKHKAVNLGNHLKPKHVKHRPDIYVDVMRPSITTYTLVLSDPDALSHVSPVKAQMCHWIVTNITLAVSANGDSGLLGLNNGWRTPTSHVVELETYFPPSPPPKTGLHRYVFALLASKPNSTAPAIPEKPKERPHWGYGKVGAGIREWALENELDIIGEYLLLGHIYLLAETRTRGKFFLLPK